MFRKEAKTKKFVIKSLCFSLFTSIILFSNTTATFAAYSGSGFATTINGKSVNQASGAGLYDFYTDEATMVDLNNVTHTDAIDTGMFLDVCSDSTCTGNAGVSSGAGTYTTYNGVGTADLANRTYTGADRTMSGLTVSASYKFSATHAAMRMLINLTNTTSSSVTRVVRKRTNLGSDGSSRLVYTNNNQTISSLWNYTANTSFGSGVLWTITTDQQAVATNTGSDPVNSYVFGEPGAAVSPLYVGSDNTADNLVGAFQVTVPANSTRSIMVIWGVGAISTTSNVLGDVYTGVTANLTSYVNLPADLKSDLTSTVQSQILNWNIGPGLTSSAGTTIGVTTNRTFTTTITPSGGTAPYSISMSPPIQGISFDTATRVITINLANPMTVQETLTVTDATSKVGTLVLTIRSNSPPTTSVTNSVVTTTVGRAVSETITASGGTTTSTGGTRPMAFTLQSSVNQLGITLDTSSAASNIAVLRIAATNVVAGTYIETITATDNNGATSVSVITVVVNAAPTLRNFSGYNVLATAGTAKAETITVTGGTSPITYVLTGSITSGTISLDTSTSASGFVILRMTSALATGTYFETVTATDSRGATAAIGMRVVVATQPVISGSASNFSASFGTQYLETFTVTGGSAPISYSLSVSPSNTGITIDPSSVSSRVTLRYANTINSGTYTIVITARDTASATSTFTRTLVVAPPMRWSLSNPTSLSTTLGTARSLRLNVTDGFSGKSFTMTQSTNMRSPGITLDTSTANDSPTAYVTLNVSNRVGPGTYSVTITGTDTTTATISTTITVTVNQPLTITKNNSLVAIGASSVRYNDSTAQYSVIPQSSQYALGSTWTIEWWQFESSTAATQTIFGMFGGLGVQIAGTTLKLLTNVSDVNLITNLVSTDRRNKWTHFAIVSQSGSISVYQNGVLLNSTPIAYAGLTSTEAPSNRAICIATRCGNNAGTSGTASNYFGGLLTDINVSKRALYSGTSTTSQNFTPGVVLTVDSQTVFNLVALPSSTSFIDISNNMFAVTDYNSPTKNNSFPTLVSIEDSPLETTHGKARTHFSYSSDGGTGSKVVSTTSNTPGISYYPGNLFVAGYSIPSISESATSLNTTTTRITYETITVVDDSGASISAQLKTIVNPHIVLTATALNPTISAGLDFYDTVTALYGTGARWLSLVGSPTTSAITVWSNVDGQMVIKVDKSVTVGTYYETVTARDFMGDTETVLITITVTPGLTLSSATGSTSFTTTQGKSASLRIDVQNGSGTKTLRLDQLGATAHSGIWLNNANLASNSFTLLTVADTVTAGTYSSFIRVTDQQGATSTITISITVNPALTISYNNATSGSITLTTTAGRAITSDAFTSANGTGARSFSLSSRNTGITIDTSTSNIAYLTLGSGLTALNSTTAGTYTETLTVTDSVSATSFRTISAIVNPAISLTASSTSRTTTVGVAIRETITATYGTGNKTFAITSSPSIAGITNTTNVLNQTVLTIPNTVGPGSYTITVTATDSVGATSQLDIALTVNSAISITGNTSMSMTTGYGFTSSTYVATNGTGAISFVLTEINTFISLETVTSSSFRLKFASNAQSNGSLAATYTETITATDSLGARTTFNVRLVVNPLISLTGSETITTTFGSSVTNVYQVTGGTAPYLIRGNPLCAPVQTIDGGFTVLSFVSVGNCQWQVPTGVTSVEYLVVGAGGGGAAGGYNSVDGKGGGGGGGGGGGQVISQTLSNLTGATMNVTVGAGGAGGSTGGRSNSSWAGTHGRNGSASSIVVGGTTYSAAGGSAGLGGGVWGVTTPPSSVCNTRSFTWDSIDIYYIDGIGGRGGNSGSGFSGQRPYCDTGTITGLGGPGGGGAGNAGPGTAPTAIGTSLQPGGAGTSSAITGTTTEYGTGGSGGGGEGGGATGSNPPTVGAAGSRAGMGGNGGAGSIRGNSGSIGAIGGAGANGLVAVRFLTPTSQDRTRLNIYTDTYLTAPGKIVVGVPDSITVGTYVETFTVTDSAGSPATNTYTVTIRIDKANPTLSISIPGGGNTATYGSPVALTATANIEGRFNFRNTGTTINGCDNRTTTGGVATCSWTPQDTATAIISAVFTPSDLTNYNTVTSSNFTLNVAQADTLTITFNSQTFTHNPNSGVNVSRAFTLSGLASIDTVTAVSTLLSGTANDATSVNLSSSNSVSTTPSHNVTKAGTFSLTGTALTFSGSTRASYYRAVQFVPGVITVNRASNAITLNYGTNNTITYRPTGTETATSTYLGNGSISYSTTSSTFCSVDGTNGALTTTQAGSCDVSLAVGQSANFLGDTLTATVTIRRASRMIEISSSALSLKYSETATITTTISFASNDGLLSYSNGSSTGCSFDGATNVLTATSGIATCTLRATIGTGTNYESATSTALSITLLKADAPTVTLIAPANVSYSPNATSSSMATPTFSITGLKRDDTVTALSDMTVTYVATGLYPYNSSVVPVNANTYTLTPSALTLSTGSISNYNTPNYVGTTWTISQITQDSLTVTSVLQEGITVPYDVQVVGGTTNGAVSMVAPFGGTATGCFFVGRNLQASSTGTCLVRASMAGNQNYLSVTSETATVLIAKFISNYFNFDSLAQGPTGITINSSVPFVVDAPSCSTGCVPTISGVSPMTAFIGDPIVITGTDFFGATEVIFNRSISVTSFTIDQTGTTITVLVPATVVPGEGTGSISVKNAAKISFRFSGLTFRPSQVVAG